MGESCEIFLNCLQKIPKSLARTHILVAPVFSDHTLKKKFKLEEMSKLLLASSVSLLVLHDPMSYGDQKRAVSCFRQQPTLKRFRELIHFHSLLKEQVTIGEISTQDLQKIVLAPSPDPGLSDVCCVLPSRYFMTYITQFLQNDCKMGPYDSNDLQGKLDKLYTERKQMLERMRTQHERAQNKKGGMGALAADKSKAGEGGDADEEMDKLMKAENEKSLMQANAEAASGIKENPKEKRLRLANWKSAKIVPDYSFGVRVLEQKLSEETEQALQQSLEEYLEDLGDEEETYLEACKQSSEQLKREEVDMRIAELRNRAEVDPVEMLRGWQRAAEESYHRFQMERVNVDKEAFDRAIANSRLEVNLDTMLEEEEQRDRPNNAPSLAYNQATGGAIGESIAVPDRTQMVDQSTLYSGAQSTRPRWQQAQAKLLAERNAEIAAQQEIERAKKKSLEEGGPGPEKGDEDKENIEVSAPKGVGEKTQEKKKKRVMLNLDGEEITDEEADDGSGMLRQLSDGEDSPTSGSPTSGTGSPDRGLSPTLADISIGFIKSKRDAAAKFAEEVRQEELARKNKPPPLDGDALRRGIALSSAEYRREQFYDQFLHKSQPTDLEDEELLEVAIEASEMTYEIERKRAEEDAERRWSSEEEEEDVNEKSDDKGNNSSGRFGNSNSGRFGNNNSGSRFGNKFGGSFGNSGGNTKRSGDDKSGGVKLPPI